MMREGGECRRKGVCAGSDGRVVGGRVDGCMNRGEEIWSGIEDKTAMSKACDR